jgi:CMP-N,N'-diacetyllegionaminic acid synthase
MTAAASAIAIILARRGSKGVPGKNTAIIGGRPCIEWTILAAQASSTLSLIAVSSDDPEALSIAKRHGLATIERPAPLASDTARVDDAARHAVQSLTGEGDNRAVCILYANAPIRPAGLIDRAVSLLTTTNADSVQSYAPVGKHHPWWTARLADDGRVLPWEGDVLNHGVFRRQDLPPAHIPDGGVLVVSRRALFLQVPGVPPGPHTFFGLDRRGVLNPEGAVVDIDSRYDLLVADAMLKDRERTP